MTICPICNGKGTQFIADYDGMYDIVCDKCKGKGELDDNGKPILTNEEWFCGLSTEEKAKWIAEEKMCRGYFIFPSMEEAIQDALEWLKQPHREG